jgi:hypothetical protein
LGGNFMNLRQRLLLLLIENPPVAGQPKQEAVLRPLGLECVQGLLHNFAGGLLVRRRGKMGQRIQGLLAVLRGQPGCGQEHSVWFSCPNQTQGILISEQMDQETGSLRQETRHLAISGGIGGIQDHDKLSPGTIPGPDPGPYRSYSYQETEYKQHQNCLADQLFPGHVFVHQGERMKTGLSPSGKAF